MEPGELSGESEIPEEKGSVLKEVGELGSEGEVGAEREGEAGASSSAWRG